MLFNRLWTDVGRKKNEEKKHRDSGKRKDFPKVRQDGFLPRRRRRSAGRRRSRRNNERLGGCGKKKGLITGGRFDRWYFPLHLQFRFLRHHADNGMFFFKAVQILFFVIPVPGARNGKREKLFITPPPKSPARHAERFCSFGSGDLFLHTKSEQSPRIVPQSGTDTGVIGVHNLSQHEGVKMSRPDTREPDKNVASQSAGRRTRLAKLITGASANPLLPAGASGCQERF